MKIKKKLKIERNDSWVYVVLLSSLSILISSIRKYTFSISGIDVGFTAILIPFIYYIIVNKYSRKKSIISLLTAVLSVSLYIIILSFALNKKINQIQLASETLPLLISGLVTIFTYRYLLKNTRKNKLLLFLTYMFSVIIYNLLYIMLVINTVSLTNYWERYLLTTIIEFIIFIPLTFIEPKKI